jgi:homoserine kinase
MTDSESENLSDPRVRSIEVTVPATSANLGAGFDVLGMALDLHNVFRVTLAEATSVEIDGDGDGMPLDDSNLFYRAFAHLHEAAGKAAPPLHIKMRLQVPPGRGLGSSATAVVGGLLAANAFMGEPFQKRDLLPHAVQLEHGRHADNVAAALLGGLVLNVVGGPEIVSLQVPVPTDLRAVLFIPEFAMDTVQGRALMPGKYDTADVVFNTGRVGLFVAAIIQGRYELLKVAMEDRLHQPYRTVLFPRLPKLIQAALQAGAHGASLSGGGSSVLALATELTPSGRSGVDLQRIAAAMQEAASEAGLPGTTRVLDIDRSGATVREVRDEI